MLLRQIDSNKLPRFLGGTCDVELQEMPGLWDQEIQQSFRDRKWNIPGNRLYNKWYLSEEERERMGIDVEGRLGGQVADAQRLKTNRYDKEEGVRLSAIFSSNYFSGQMNGRSSRY